jgi:hypothetical protein
MLKLSNKHFIVIGIVGLNLAAISIPMVTHAATTNSVIGLTVQPVLISYSSSGTVTLGTITPTSGGLQSTSSDSISADTNDGAGLTVSLQENSGSTTAMLSGSNTLPTSAGTTTTPVVLAADTWGWREDSLAGTGFGAGPTSTISNAAPSALKFAAIPANGSPYTIETTSTSGSSNASIWYSAMVDTSQPSGAYSTTVTYTFTTN